MHDGRNCKCNQKTLTPFVIILPRPHFKFAMLNGAPTSNLGVAPPKGWISGSCSSKTAPNLLGLKLPEISSKRFINMKKFDFDINSFNLF